MDGWTWVQHTVKIPDWIWTTQCGICVIILLKINLPHTRLLVSLTLFFCFIYSICLQVTWREKHTGGRAEQPTPVFLIHLHVSGLRNPGLHHTWGNTKTRSTHSTSLDIQGWCMLGLDIHKQIGLNVNCNMVWNTVNKQGWALPNHTDVVESCWSWGEPGFLSGRIPQTHHDAGTLKPAAEWPLWHEAHFC